MLTVVCTSPQVLFEERILQAMLTVVYVLPLKFSKFSSSRSSQALEFLKPSKFSSSQSSQVLEVLEVLEEEHVDFEQEAGGLEHP